ncbi:MAG: NPCBM/NEW2 domain-containing protein, partial [Planctomycetaceae bacterium]|nr:NPCBM/NEW2 domain-containing protein [Planctomycetaceae bacterium]
MRCSIFLTLCFTLLFHFSFQVFAQDQSSPFAPTSTDFSVWGPRLPNDKIMPEKEKIEQIKSWVAAAFAKKKAEPINVPFTIKLIRQDHNTLKFNQSCMGTPFQIGTKSFENGLGTHANSEILIEFAEPITRFTAQVGIDNNYDTQGTKGSVQFIVQVQNKELLRTPILTGKDEPYKIDLKLPDGTKNLTLLVSTTDDGPNHDQSNWCEPVAYGVSGQSYLITKTELPFQTELPFSFQYGGVASSELLPKWTFEEKILNPLETAYRWTDPKTKFRVTATVRLFERFCAADWVLHFENGSNQDSLLLENVRTFDMTFPVGIGNEPVCIHTLNGDTYSEFTWLPAKYPLKPGETKTFAPAGGRPSNYAFPFWNVQNRNAGDETVSKGFFIAIGWSGQWKTDFKRIDETNLAVAGGMETLSAILHPNESIRTPRVLIMPWETDRLTSQVLFRRLLMFEYAPKMQNGLPQQLLFVGQCFDRYYRKRTGWETIDSQKQFAQKLAEAGCNAYWFDAAWFPVGFPNGVGNWFSDPVNFPNGVEELGKTVHDLGLKFVLWFEPERVAAGTQIAKEYSRYVFGGENGGLYKLNDPEAQKFLSDLLIKRIKEFGVDVYRNDFNIDPLHFWKQNEENNRHGITEIRYVEGHYEMWNRFRSEFPGLWIDNCASGGRRIDLETTTISIPLWRSDTCCFPGRPEWDQTQTLGITQYLPVFSSVAWDSSPYTFRSAANMGAILQYDFLGNSYNSEQSKKSIQEAKIYQKFWYGDFYPLSEAKVGETDISAWQLHRSDLEAGLIYIFRQRQSPFISRELQLRAIEPDEQYSVTVKPDYSPQKA